MSRTGRKGDILTVIIQELINQINDSPKPRSQSNIFSGTEEGRWEPEYVDFTREGFEPVQLQWPYGKWGTEDTWIYDHPSLPKQGPWQAPSDSPCRLPTMDKHPLLTSGHLLTSLHLAGDTSAVSNKMHHDNESSSVIAIVGADHIWHTIAGDKPDLTRQQHQGITDKRHHADRCDCNKTSGAGSSSNLLAEPALTKEVTQSVSSSPNPMYYHADLFMTDGNDLYKDFRCRVKKETTSHQQPATHTTAAVHTLSHPSTERVHPVTLLSSDTRCSHSADPGTQRESTTGAGSANMLGLHVGPSKG
ncbi:hypothetical protein RSAG8_13127, partial [Rhizoctonia solani AG-8 WAC10335]